MTMLEVLVGFGCLVAAALGVLSLVTFHRRRKVRRATDELIRRLR